MPQQIRILDVTRSYRPVDPDTVAPKIMSDSSLAREDEEPLFPFDGYNFLPTTYGYKSFFGDLDALQADPVTPNQDYLFTFQNIEYSTSIIALGEDGLRVKWDPTGLDTSWLHIELPADLEIYKPWTYALLNNNLYMYRAFDPHFYVIYFDPAKALLHPDYDANDSAWKYRPYKLTPTFLNMEGQVGLFRAGIRLGFWDAANAVAVSSVDDPTDFTPSASTLAGVSVFSHVEGRITHILPFKDGFIIYAMANIVLVERDLGSSLLWSTRIIFDRGVAYRRQVVSEKTYEVHYAITESSVIQIDGSKVTKIVPELYELMQNTDKPYFLYLLDERYLCFMTTDSNQARKIRSKIYDSRLEEQEVPVERRRRISFPVLPQNLHASELDYLYSDWADTLSDLYGPKVTAAITIPAISIGTTNTTVPVAGTTVELPGIGTVPLNSSLPHYYSGILNTAPQYVTTQVSGSTVYDLPYEARLFELKTINFLYQQTQCMLDRLHNIPSNLVSDFPTYCTTSVRAIRDEDGVAVDYTRVAMVEDYIYKDIRVELLRNLIVDWELPITCFTDQGILVASKVTQAKRCYALGDIIHVPADETAVSLFFSEISNVVWSAFVDGSRSVTEDLNYVSHWPAPEFGNGFIQQMVDSTWDSFAAMCGSVLPLSQNIEIRESFPFPLPFRLADSGYASLIAVNLVGSCAATNGAVTGFSQLWKIYAKVSGLCHLSKIRNPNGPQTYWHKLDRLLEDEDPDFMTPVVGGFLQIVKDSNGNLPSGVTPWTLDPTAALSIPELQTATVPPSAIVAANPMVNPAGSILNTHYYRVHDKYSPVCTRHLNWGHTPPPMPPFTVSIVQGSHEIPYPKYEGCFLYDTNLQKWGKQVGPSASWFSLVPINRADPLVVEARELVRQAGYLRTDGRLILFSNTPTQSEIVYGKIGLSRAGFTDAERLIIHQRKALKNQEYDAKFSVELEMSMEGRAASAGKDLYIDSIDQEIFDLPIRASARWYNIVIRGWYDISYIEFRGSASGRR